MIERLKAALAALVASTGELHRYYSSPTDMQLIKNHNAITDLQAVIAEMESAEPRAWVNWSALTGQPRLGFECESEIASEPLFTHPQPKAEPAQEPVAKDVNSTHTIPAQDCVLSNDDYHEGEVAEMGKRLFYAVETLAHQAGEDASETVNWLCDQSGMFKLFEKYFSPAAAPQAKPVQEQKK